MTEENGKEKNLKDVISSDLAHFLLKEGVEPESIKIEVQYAGTTARLKIESDKLDRIKDVSR